MRSISKLIFLVLFHTSIFSGCSGKKSNKDPEQNNTFSQTNSIFPYNLKEPASKTFLPFELEEISGISYLTDNMLACVQDEKGIVYTYSLAEEKIIKREEFAENGDYEDIEVIKDFAYILRSDGQLWKVQLDTPKPEIEQYSTPLTIKNDVEGLGYDAANNRLLLACKGISGLGKNISGIRAVYAFDLQENRLIEEPVFSIETDEVKQLASGKHAKGDFRSSGIAVHPLSGQVYVLASVGKVLIILDKKGTIQDVHSLSDAHFKQPEGICFSPEGDLFISNEGSGGKATILRFNDNTQ